MIDFSTLQGLTIPEGVVAQIADANGRVLWSGKVHTLYMRPTADISINHSLYPADSATAYLLISEEEPDGDSTYIEHTFRAGDTASYSKESSFRFSCASSPQGFGRIKSAKLYVHEHGWGDDGSVYGAALTDYRRSATINIDGDVSHSYDVSVLVAGTLSYDTYCADITDVMQGKYLSSSFVVTLKQSCTNCTAHESEGTGGGIKTQDIHRKRISTVWIEVEYT